MSDQERQQLLKKLSRGLVYTTPLLIAMTGAAAIHGVYSDLAQRPNEQLAPASTPKAAPEAAPEATPEATPEAAPEATPEAAPEAMPEAMPEAGG